MGDTATPHRITDCPICGQPTTLSCSTGYLTTICPNNHHLPKPFICCLHRALNAQIGFPLFLPINDPITPAPSPKREN